MSSKIDCSPLTTMKVAKFVALTFLLVCFVDAQPHTAKVGRDHKNVDIDFQGLGDDIAARQMKASRAETMARYESEKLKFDASAANNEVSARDIDGRNKVSGRADEANGNVRASDGKNKVDATGKNGGAIANDGQGNRAVGKAGPNTANGAVGQHSARAGGKGDNAVANAAGEEAKAQRIHKDGDFAGGAANAAGGRGILKNTASDAQMTGSHDGNDGSLDVKKSGDSSVRGSATDKQTGDQTRFGADSVSQTKTQGNGRIQHDRNSMKYEVNQNGANEANLRVEDQNMGILKKTKGITCDAVKDGVSTCLTDEGKSAGKVKVISKTEVKVENADGVAVARAQAKKVSDSEYLVTVQEGLLTATMSDYKTQDCSAQPEISDKVTIHDDMQVQPDSTVDDNGDETFSWPSCFNVTMTVDIAEDIDPSRVALEYKVDLMPLGTMKCSDSSTCGGTQCYYCNACQKLEQREMEWTGYGAVCDKKAPGSKKMTMRVCPKEEDIEYVRCTGFGRSSLGDAFNAYKDSLNAEARVWLRPAEENIVRKQYLSGNIPNRLLLEAQYKTKNPHKLLAKIEDYELFEFKMQQSQKLAACKSVKMDYEIKGAEVPATMMLDAFNSISTGAHYKLLPEKPCAEYTEEQRKLWQNEKSKSRSPFA